MTTKDGCAGPGNCGRSGVNCPPDDGDRPREGDTVEVVKTRDLGARGITSPVVGTRGKVIPSPGKRKDRDPAWVWVGFQPPFTDTDGTQWLVDVEHPDPISLALDADMVRVVERGPPSTWSEKHVAEAMARTYEIAAGLMRAGNPIAAAVLAHFDTLAPLPLQAWRNLLESSAALSTRRIRREVQLVRDIAEGRKVREKGWRVDGAWYDDEEITDARRQRDAGRNVVRVTRIRKVGQ